MADVLTVGVVPSGSSINAGPVDRELFERLFGDPAGRVGVALVPLGVTPVPDRAVALERVGDTWWVSADASADPCQVDGHHVVPEQVLNHVRRLYAAGVRPHYLRVLHEVPDRSWSPGKPLPSLVPGPQSHRAADAMILAGIGGAIGGAAKVARGAGSVAAGLVTVAAAIAVAPVALLGDPVLLGGRRIGEDRVLWAELARWTWS